MLTQESMPVPVQMKTLNLVFLICNVDVPEINHHDEAISADKVGKVSR